ncbi:MAG: peptidoglycan glycosyltransferase, partial [Chloroflexota bacterium]
VVRRVTTATGEVQEAKPERRRVISEQAAKTVTGMLEEVVTGGTAKRAMQFGGYRAAGKTGTAEFFTRDGKKSQHAWFTGFAPYNDPEVVVTVYFDIGVGGDKAAPVAGKIFDYFMEHVQP